MSIKKILMILGGIAIAIVLAAGTAVFLWAAYQERMDNTFTRTVATLLPVPAARVGAAEIPLSQFYKDVDSLRTYYGSDDAKASGLDISQFGDEAKAQALERLIEEAAIREMAAQERVSVSSTDIEQAIDKQFVTPSSTRKELEQQIKKMYGWTMEDFREHVVTPILLERKLAEKKNPTDPQTGLTDVVAALSERIQRADVVRYVKYELPKP